MNTTIFLVYVATSVAGLMLMKGAEAAVSARFAAGFALYAAGFLLWLWLLRRIPLNVAFPIAAGALIVCTQIASYVILHEPVSAPQMLGVALIFSGVGVLVASGLLH